MGTAEKFLYKVVSVEVKKPNPKQTSADTWA